VEGVARLAPEVSESLNYADDHLYELIRGSFIKELGSELGLACHRWLVFYRADPKFLRKLYKHDWTDPDEVLVDEGTGFSYQRSEESLIVKTDYETFSFALPTAKWALRVMIDATEDYLPLGSVVDLKKEEFSDLIDPATIENFRVIITQRLIFFSDIPVYFNYGATVYPIGAFKGAESIYLNPDLIERVVYRGFSDDEDKAYVLAMKLKLLFDGAYVSFDFAPEDLREQAINRLRKKEPPDD